MICPHCGEPSSPNGRTDAATGRRLCGPCTMTSWDRDGEGRES